MYISSIEEFAERFSVSRETINRFSIFESLIRKWSPVINIVAKSTIENIWPRHFLDSAEIFPLSSSQSGRWVDLGSGGGLPGLVVAILAAELTPELAVTCVESDIRKCEFMRTVSRATGVRVGIVSRRVEQMTPQNAAVISARALAPLDKLLTLVQPHLAADGIALLHKGINWEDEVETALESWQFAVEKLANPANPDSVILKIGGISRG